MSYDITQTSNYIDPYLYTHLDNNISNRHLVSFLSI